jgi:antitoxin (DNA-binding transcriptional repressor) of toxin-antitoxin stability system
MIVKSKPPKLLRLLDEVKRGETLVLTRHGHRTDRLVPEADTRQAEIDAALAAIASLRSETGRVVWAELLSARDADRR